MISEGPAWFEVVTTCRRFSHRIRQPSFPPLPEPQPNLTSFATTTTTNNNKHNNKHNRTGLSEEAAAFVKEDAGLSTTTFTVKTDYSMLSVEEVG